jgi:hypothetical protein
VDGRALGFGDADIGDDFFEVLFGDEGAHEGVWVCRVADAELGDGFGEAGEEGLDDGGVDEDAGAGCEFRMIILYQ